MKRSFNKLGFMVVFAAAPTFAAGDGVLILSMIESKEGKQIAAFEADGSGYREITSGADFHLYPDIDASGRYAAYVEGSDARQLGVVIQDIETGKIEQWTDKKGLHLQPTFSGDGETLAFSGPLDDGGENRIGIIDLGRHTKARARFARSNKERKRFRPKVRVLESEHPAFFPALSSNGGFIVYHESRSKTNRVIVMHDLVEGGTRTLSDPDGLAMAPALSTDDRFVAYTRKLDGRWNIIIKDWRAGTEKQVTDTPAQDFAPAFLPDGSLLFASDRGGRFALYRLSPEAVASGTGKAEPLLEKDGDLYSPAASGERKFTQKSMRPLEKPARSSFGVARIGSTIFAVGGHQGPEHTYPEESFLARVDAFDARKRRWKRVAARPVRAHGYDVVSYGKYLYAFGGFTYSADHDPKWKSVDAIDRYDTEADRWETVARLPDPRSSNAAVRVGTKVYLIGGWNSTPRAKGDKKGSFHDAVDVFDLETEIASRSPHRIPAPLRRAISGVRIDEKIVIAGGITQGARHFSLVDSVTRFDPETGQWENLPPLPSATFAPALGEIDGELVLFGGMHRFGERSFDYVSHIYALAPNAKSWRHTGRYLREAKGFSQVSDLPGGDLMIIGGHGYGGGDAPVRTVERFGARRFSGTSKDESRRDF